MFILIGARGLEFCQRRHRDKISCPTIWPCNSKRALVFGDIFCYAPAHDSKKTLPVGTKDARSRAMGLLDEGAELCSELRRKQQWRDDLGPNTHFRIGDHNACANRRRPLAKGIAPQPETYWQSFRIH